MQVKTPRKPKEKIQTICFGPVGAFQLNNKEPDIDFLCGLQATEFIAFSKENTEKATVDGFTNNEKIKNCDRNPTPDT